MKAVEIRKLINKQLQARTAKDDSTSLEIFLNFKQNHSNQPKGPPSLSYYKLSRLLTLQSISNMYLSLWTVLLLHSFPPLDVISLLLCKADVRSV